MSSSLPSFHADFLTDWMEEEHSKELYFLHDIGYMASQRFIRWVLRCLISQKSSALFILKGSNDGANRRRVPRSSKDQGPSETVSTW